jgi:hypothetical protein
MAAHKGHARAGGRVKGTPNHITKDLREAIMHAFDKVGGEDYLVTVARKNPAVFCALLARILPLQVNTAGATIMPERAAALARSAGAEGWAARHLA